MSVIEFKESTLEFEYKFDAKHFNSDEDIIATTRSLLAEHGMVVGLALAFVDYWFVTIFIRKVAPKLNCIRIFIFDDSEMPRIFNV